MYPVNLFRAYRHSESLQEELWTVYISEMTYKSAVKFPFPVLA